MVCAVEGAVGGLELSCNDGQAKMWGCLGPLICTERGSYGAQGHADN